MHVTAEDLPRRLAGELPAAILLFGEEPLLIDESARHIRRAAREQGFSDRIPLSVEAGFDWGRLAGSSQTLSLFSERRLVELRLPGGRPGDAGTRAIVHYCQAAAADVCLLVIAGRLDAAMKKAKWVKTLDRSGWVLEHRTPERRQFDRWFRQRLAERGLALDEDAVTDMCHWLEGNLLAAVQEIDRLALFADASGVVAPEVVRAGQADHARFNAYAAVDAGLAGDARQALRILRVLQGEGVEPAIVVWAFARDLRVLVRVEHGQRSGRGVAELFGAQRVWRARQPLMKSALARLGAPRLQAAMHQMAQADRVLKGRAHGNVWRELDVLVLIMCDISIAAVNHGAS